MVDVHGGEPLPARDDPVDELLERNPLVLAVSPPHRLVDDFAGVVPEAVAEEVLEPARGLVERVALHVEPDVARVGRGHEAEAALGLVREEFPEVALLPAAAQLQLRLVADTLERLSPGVRLKPDTERPGQHVAQLLQRPNPRVDQRLRLRTTHARDQRKVIVIDPLLPAAVTEVADPAVAAGPAVGLLPRRERAEEPITDATVVRLELDGAERLTLAEPVLDVNVLDRRALQASDLLGVEQELQHVRRLRLPCELRVDGLVAAVRLLLEEVGETAPAPVLTDEVRLVDHLRRTRANRLLRESLRLDRVEPLVVVGRDPRQSNDPPATSRAR